MKPPTTLIALLLAGCATTAVESSGERTHPAFAFVRSEPRWQVDTAQVVGSVGQGSLRIEWHAEAGREYARITLEGPRRCGGTFREVSLIALENRGLALISCQQFTDGKQHTDLHFDGTRMTGIRRGSKHADARPAIKAMPLTYSILLAATLPRRGGAATTWKDGWVLAASSAEARGPRVEYAGRHQLEHDDQPIHAHRYECYGSRNRPEVLIWFEDDGELLLIEFIREEELGADVISHADSGEPNERLVRRLLAPA